MGFRKTLLLDKVNQLVDWFIPEELAKEETARKQSRVFLLSHLFGPFIGNVVPIALYVLDPNPGYQVAVLAISITAFWLFPFLLRATGAYNVLAIISVQNLTFCILWSCFFYGGVSSPTLPWVLTIPLLAFFYLGEGRTLRLVVLGLFALNLLIFGSAYALGYSVPDEMPLSSRQGLGLLSTAAASLYVAMMALYYGNVLASGVELESEMKRHLATADELRKATAEAERAGAAKAEFLAKMSHELRTPLNAVIGYSQILLEDAIDEGDSAAQSDLDRIHGAGQHLLRLVNEILDLSKIEAGKMELVQETVKVADLLRAAAEPYGGAAAKTGTDLVVRVDENIGTMVCDGSRFAQIVQQLVDNGVKFTTGGQVVVTARRVVALGSERVVIEVRDTGIGISPATIPLLFEKFSVAEDVTESKYGGTGLGLALSYRLCKLMGGHISVESEVGVGSTFKVTLPVQPPASSADVGQKRVSADEWAGDHRLQAA